MIKQNRPRRSRTPGARPRSQARAKLRELDLVIPLAFRSYRAEGVHLRTLANHQVRAMADDARAGRLHRAERAFDAAAKELRSWRRWRAVSLARLELYRAKDAQRPLGEPVAPHLFAMREPKSWPHPGSCTSPRRSLEFCIRAAKRASSSTVIRDTGRTSLRGDLRSNLPRSGGVREVTP